MLPVTDAKADGVKLVSTVSSTDAVNPRPPQYAAVLCKSYATVETTAYGAGP